MRRFFSIFAIAGMTASAAIAAPDVTQMTSKACGFKLARPTAAVPPAKVPVARPAAPRAATSARAPYAAPSARSWRARSRYAARPRIAPVAVVPVAAPQYSYVGAPPNLMVTRIDLRLSFKDNSAELTEQSKQEAAVFAKSLLAPERLSKRFVIEGHTYSVGGRAFNMDLSQRRAQSVATFLASQGVDSGRMEVRGLGFDVPRSGLSASSPSNQRVEAVLTS